MLGIFGEGGDPQADGGHGGVDEDEEGEVSSEVAFELPKEFHEEAHPERLHEDDHAEKEKFGEEIGRGGEAAEFFFFERCCARRLLRGRHC